MNSMPEHFRKCAKPLELIYVCARKYQDSRQSGEKLIYNRKVYSFFIQRDKKIFSFAQLKYTRCGPLSFRSPVLHSNRALVVSSCTAIFGRRPEWLGNECMATMLFGRSTSAMSGKRKNVDARKPIANN